MTTRLQAVHVAVADLDRATTVYRAILGTSPRRQGATVRLPAGETAVMLSGRGSQGAGVAAIDLVVDSLADRAEALSACELSYTAGMGRIVVELHGLEVRLAQPQGGAADEEAGTAFVDHLALRVENLSVATGWWEAATGVEAEIMGIHPVSGGAFSASRIHLGQQMIELVAPEPGVDSPMAERLASHGEGPAALALPSSALDETRQALDGLGVRVFRSDPHWMVHPADAESVLIQLTPRVEH